MLSVLHSLALIKGNFKKVRTNPNLCKMLLRLTHDKTDRKGNISVGSTNVKCDIN
jgi:hypothetical protein